MRPSTLFLPLATLLVTVSGRPACNGTYKNGKAIYLITNDDVNAVVALPIKANGLLGAGTRLPTGGAGSNAINGATNEPAAPDALVSQSAITVAGEYLFAVNPGSNSITMMLIDKKDPTKLTVVGSPAVVPGEFPNTVAASLKKKLVCVGSSGAKAGVSCSSFSAAGMTAMDELRPFDLNQTTPPIGPTNTVSQAFFSNDENTLFVTVKGDPTKNNTGFLAAYQVEHSYGCEAGFSVSQDGKRSSPAGTAVLFGSSTIPASENIFVTDASFGAAVLSFDPQTSIAMVQGKGVIQDQKATCWATISPATGTAFVTDVAIDRLVEMSVLDASIQGEIDLSANGDPGLIDLRAAGRHVYALSPGNGTTSPAIAVVDVIGRKQVQHFQLQDMGVTKNAQGMAIMI